MCRIISSGLVIFVIKQTCYNNTIKLRKNMCISTLLHISDQSSSQDCWYRFGYLYIYLCAYMHKHVYVYLPYRPYIVNECIYLHYIFTYLYICPTLYTYIMYESTYLCVHIYITIHLFIPPLSHPAIRLSCLDVHMSVHIS